MSQVQSRSRAESSQGSASGDRERDNYGDENRGYRTGGGPPTNSSRNRLSVSVNSLRDRERERSGPGSIGGGGGGGAAGGGGGGSYSGSQSSNSGHQVSNTQLPPSRSFTNSPLNHIRDESATSDEAERRRRSQQGQQQQQQLQLPSSASRPQLQSNLSSSPGVAIFNGEPFHDMERAISLLKSSKFYAEGFLLKRVEVGADGKSQTGKAGTWSKWFVQLSGAIMSTWNAQEMEEAAREGRTVELLTSLSLRVFTE